jgi:hypothetical protein
MDQGGGKRRCVIIAWADSAKEPFMILILWYVAFWSPVLALVGTIFLYRQHCKARPTHRIPARVYAAIILVCAVVAYLAGMILANEFLCSSPSSGNLCGLIGIFIWGPLASAFTILSIALLILLLPRDK